MPEVGEKKEKTAYGHLLHKIYMYEKSILSGGYFFTPRYMQQLQGLSFVAVTCIDFTTQLLLNSTISNYYYMGMLQQ